MIREENIRAILECNFAGFKDDIIDNAVKRICEIEQEPKTDILNKLRKEIEEKAERYCLSRESIYMGQVEWSERLIKESDVLKIIDEYSQEV